LHILICSPEHNPATGNWVTSSRYQRGLQKFGHQVTLCSLSGGDQALQEAVAHQRPDLLLLLHAFRSGRQWLNSRLQHIPTLVMLSGTDLNEGLYDRVQAPVIEQVLERAQGLLIQNPLGAEQLRRQRPALAERLHMVPPGIELGTQDYPLRQKHHISADVVLFLCPASIRPVKGVLALIELFDQLPARPAQWQLAFCGPQLNSAYSQHFSAAAGQRPWVHCLGIIPPDAMASVLRQADVILNNSISEGLPNALIEAASLGRPILAHDIPGNRPIVEPGVNGLLYRDAATFARAARKLIDSPELRLQLSHPCPEKYHPDSEADALHRICCGVRWGSSQQVNSGAKERLELFDLAQ
jgi:glycosyltransferase involved in cell wall biosynthesis